MYLTLELVLAQHNHTGCSKPSDLVRNDPWTGDHEHQYQQADE